MYIKLVEKMAISAPVGGKIRSQAANEGAKNSILKDKWRSEKLGLKGQMN